VITLNGLGHWMRHPESMGALLLSRCDSVND